MDISVKMPDGKFNYRVCAIIIRDGKVLAMKDNHADYYYFPGGRVQFGEDSETAVLRELKEELNIDAEIIRPLWFVQSFFNEDVLKIDYHELCIYYLIDVTKTHLIDTPDTFLGIESHKCGVFEWLDLTKLSDKYLYPLFIKERIKSLPTALEMIVERQ